MLGDQTLFAHRDGVEATWALYTPILEAWAAKNPEVFPNYFAGNVGTGLRRPPAGARRARVAEQPRQAGVKTVVSDSKRGATQVSIL